MMPFVIRQEGDAIVLDVQVVPRASRDRVGPVVGDRLKVQLTAPPVDGAANEALRALLARTFGVARGRVQIVRGETGRKKTVRIDGLAATEAERLVGAAP
jgi:uncharacterized protein (TIGR00251 family)